jgi:hypothetical protein
LLASEHRHHGQALGLTVPDCSNSRARSTGSRTRIELVPTRSTRPLKETAMPDTADRSPHLLVLADVWCGVEALCDEVLLRAGNAGRVLVVAPALASRLHTWTNDTDRESEIAQARLENVLARLEQQGVRAEGRIADQDPALAVEDALDGFAATEVIVVTEDHEHANWSEHGLTARIARPGLAVTRLTVAHEQAL